MSKKLWGEWVKRRVVASWEMEGEEYFKDKKLYFLLHSYSLYE